MEQLVREMESTQDFQTTNAMTYCYTMICLGYAIKACKATEAIEGNKGNAGGKKKKIKKEKKKPNDIREA